MDGSQVFQLLSGIALFLFGMKLMGDGLKKVSGGSLAQILYRLTGTPLRAVLLGTGVTAVLQSSCATSVMAVGFVNSGMMKVRQSVGVILGSILGTSITGWIICLNYIEGASGVSSLLSAQMITTVAAVAGVFLCLFSKKQSRQLVGEIIVGFAILMQGMSSMSGAVSPLRESEAFIAFLTRFENPLLGFVAGALFTAVLQSASAAVGILQALSVTGAMSLSASVPMLLGVTVGAAFPVLLAAIGAGTDGKRAALIYPIGAVFGSVVYAVLYYIAYAVFRFPATETVMDPFSLAGLNTLMRFIMIVLLTPLMSLIEKTAAALVPEKGGTDQDPFRLLDERFLRNTGVAIEQCRIVLTDMASTTRENITEALALLPAYSQTGYDHVQEVESLVDQYEDKLGTYIIQITSAELTQKQNEDVYQFLHAITDLERISDHASNIAISAKEIHDKGIELCEEVLAELSVMRHVLTDVVDISFKALTEHDWESAYRVEPLEQRIDDLCAELSHRCVDRLTKGVYSRQESFVFNDLVSNFERVSDHCSNLAVAMIELKDDAFDTHNYLDTLMAERGDVFEKYLDEYTAKYSFD